MNFSTFFLKASFLVFFFFSFSISCSKSYSLERVQICVSSLQSDSFISMTIDFVKRIVKLYHTSFNYIFLWEMSCVILNKMFHFLKLISVFSCITFQFPYLLQIMLDKTLGLAQLVRAGVNTTKVVKLTTI